MKVLLLFILLLTSCGADKEIIFVEKAVNDEIIPIMQDEIARINEKLSQMLDRLDGLVSRLDLIEEVLQNTVEVQELCETGGEILIRLPDDTLAAFMQNGSAEYLTILEPGDYRTTDGENCHFIVDEDNNIIIPEEV